MTNNKKRKADEPASDSAQTRNKQPNRNDSVRQQTRPATPTNITPVSNRFEILRQQKDDECDDEQPPATKPKHQRAPAPINIAGIVTNHTEFVNSIRRNTKGDFHIKYTANNINLYLEKELDKKELVKAFTEEKVEYHTYTDAAEKTHAFIIRGLDGLFSPEEIKQELFKMYKISVRQVFKLKNTVRPLYMVTTDASHKLKDLEINVKYLFYTKIKWERYNNKRIIIQCHRCQQWGHATANCNRNPKCLKCAEDHITRACEKSADTPAKCVNCNGPHPANYSECPHYLRKLQERERNIEARQPPPKTKYEPAPPPKTNAWSQQQTSTSTSKQQTADLAPDSFPPLRPSNNSSVTLPAPL